MSVGWLILDLTRACECDVALERYCILAICYIYHHLYGTCDTYKSTSGTSQFIFTVAMKVLVNKSSMFASKL